METPDPHETDPITTGRQTLSINVISHARPSKHRNPIMEEM
jgi:hypothetical protein